MNRNWKSTRKQLQPYIDTARTSPYVGWVVMNIAVWSLGLYGMALCIRFLGLVGAPIGVTLLGLIVGGGQSWVLRRLLPITSQRWTGTTILGAILGTLPIALLFLWVLLVAVLGLNGVLFMLGGIFGGILGATQAYTLHPLVYEKAGWWILANVIAGAMCAPLSLTGASLWLPVFCSLGPITFGILTAWSLRYVVDTLDVD